MYGLGAASASWDRECRLCVFLHCLFGLRVSRVMPVVSSAHAQEPLSTHSRSFLQLRQLMCRGNGCAARYCDSLPAEAVSADSETWAVVLGLFDKATSATVVLQVP